MCVCAFTKPYTYGHLNRQLIYVLTANKVPEESFLSLQEEYLDLFSRMHTDAEAAAAVLCWHGKFGLASLVAGFTAEAWANFRRTVEVHHRDVKEALDHIARNFLMKDEKKKKRKISDMEGEEKEEEVSHEKLRIMVKKSRNLRGVCDQVKYEPFVKIAEVCLIF